MLVRSVHIYPLATRAGVRKTYEEISKKEEIIKKRKNTATLEIINILVRLNLKNKNSGERWDERAIISCALGCLPLT